MMERRPTVLLVDDDTAIWEMLGEEFCGEGYDCDFASNADDALTKLDSRRFDMALLDIKLPGISGIDLLKTVQKRHKITAIIMITGVNDVNTAVEVMRLGALDYVVKPFAVSKLIVKINAFLRGRKLSCPARDIMPDKSSVNPTLRQIDAIACGVDARVNHFDFHSKIVANKTVETARWLGFPEEQIKEWAEAWSKQYSERDRRIKDMLNKLEGSQEAQAILGLTCPVFPLPESRHLQNWGGTKWTIL